MERPAYAKVIIDLPSQEVDHPYEYAIPCELSSKIEIGSMILVNFGHALRIGYVIQLTSKATVASPSPILDLIEEEPVLNRNMIKLCEWIANYYYATLSQALRLALPPGRTRQISQCITATGDMGQALKSISQRAGRQLGVVKCIHEAGGKVPISKLQQEFGPGISSTLGVLEEKGIIRRIYELKEPATKERTEEHSTLAVSAGDARDLADRLRAKAPKQSEMLELLISEPTVPTKRLLASTGSSRQSLKSLMKKGFVATSFSPAFREPESYYPERIAEMNALTDEQKHAIRMIEATLEKKAFRVFLLQGVTGSGKTEIYIRLIKKLLKAGKTAMVLVPEIALTPQTAHRFRNAFGDSVAVLHSGMRLGERFDQWRRIRAGQYRVVVGARSALFAPLSDLGMIVVDEEHESSYKQNRNPRYHAVDVAIKRAEVEGCPVILGSATPAIESCHKARSGRFGHILLTKRVENRKLPSIEIVDMKEEFKQGNRGIFSLALQEEMHKCLTMEDKFILFINRRGYASFLLCRDCGYVPKCNRCAVSFTYHRDRMRLVCHHCNCNTAVPTNCPECGSRRIGDFGIGTQKVESELDKLIPGLNIIRMDADTTKGRDSHRKKLIEFYHQKRSVLLGTQMIAKGLDFPEVTLVGIINGDTALNLPDFRAAERTFQLLMQVSGRAGRGSKPGKVVLQTYFPESYALSAVSVGDYDGFFEQEIDLRRELLYPPFCQLINIVISGSNSNRVEAVAQEIIGLISDGNQNEITEVLGPAPAPLSKIKGHHRWHIILKVSDSEPACRFLQERLRSLNGSKLGRGVNLTVDVDPVWML